MLFAFAMKSIVGHAGDERDSVAAVAVCGGGALYLLTYAAIRMRVERRVVLSRGRLHTYELVWWREAHAEWRSVLASS